MFSFGYVFVIGPRICILHLFPFEGKMISEICNLIAYIFCLHLLFWNPFVTRLLFNLPYSYFFCQIVDKTAEWTSIGKIGLGSVTLGKE